VLFLTEHHATKAHWGSRDTTPLILNLGTRWRRVVSFTPRTLYSQEKSPWYQLDRRPGEHQSRSGRGGEEKNSQPLPGLERTNYETLNYAAVFNVIVIQKRHTDRLN